MHAMMQCKAKSENLAHILGYQIWAVTIVHMRLTRYYLGSDSLMKAQSKILFCTLGTSWTNMEAQEYFVLPI